MHSYRSVIGDCIAINLDSNSTGCGAAACPTTSTTSSERIHSTDIAFKPNKDGWGYSKKYSNNFETIFRKKKDPVNESENSTTKIN
jgi:predicted glutamine amidotransferase